MPVHLGELPPVQTAAVLQDGDAGVKLLEVSVPSLDSGQILVKITWSGLCHSDVAIMRNYLPGTPFRDMTRNNALGILGHEGVGRVVAMAKDVATEALWKIGDRAGIKWISSTCGTCDFCSNGKDEIFCQAQQNPGTTAPGTFQQYVATDARFATRVPEGVKDEEAAPLLCAGLTAYGATNKSQVHVGEWLVILGAGGGVGHLSLQYAKFKGIRTIAVDLGPEKENFCRELGADHFIDAATDTNIVGTVHSMTGHGAHGVVMATLDQKAHDMAPQLLRPRGIMVVVAFPKSLEFKAGANPLLMASKMIAIVGSTTGTRDEMNAVLDLAARRIVLPVITTAPLHQLNDLVDRIAKGGILGKVVVRIAD